MSLDAVTYSSADSCSAEKNLDVKGGVIKESLISF
jgi:hypothetical protein